MTTDRPEASNVFVPLSDKPGPARAISDKTARDLARAVVARAIASRPVFVPPQAEAQAGEPWPEPQANGPWSVEQSAGNLLTAEIRFTELGAEPGPAQPMEPQTAEALARAVVRRARSRRTWRVPVPLQWAAAAALVFAAGGGALAAVARYVLRPSAPEKVQMAETRPPQQGHGKTTGARTAAKPLAQLLPQPIPKAQPIAAPPIEAKTMQAPPLDARAGTRHERPAFSRPRTSAPPPHLDAAAHHVPPPSAASPAPPPVVDLLQQANQQRAAGRFAQAERLYTRIVDGSDQADTVYVALVAAATLRLEHLDQAAHALAYYRRALLLRPTGTLSPAARFGIAECQRALRNPAEEEQALRALLRAHPHHPLRARADQRLRQLRSTDTR